MSAPNFIADRIFLSEYFGNTDDADAGLPNRSYKIHFVTFATSDWTFAGERYRAQLDFIRRNYGYFATARVLSELDLPADWHRKFDRFSGDHAYAMWAWKPRVVRDTLDLADTGDVVVYLDGGCTFPRPTNMGRFLTELTASCDAVRSGRYVCAATKYPLCPVGCEANASTKLLTYYNLRQDESFLHRFPHWQTGALIMTKSPSAIQFADKWVEAFDHYDDVIKRDWKNRDGELPGFAHDGGDQGIFQAILYKGDLSVLDITELIYGSGVVAHIRR